MNISCLIPHSSVTRSHYEDNLNPDWWQSVLSTDVSSTHISFSHSSFPLFSFLHSSDSSPSLIIFQIFLPLCSCAPLLRQSHPSVPRFVLPTVFLPCSHMYSFIFCTFSLSVVPKRSALIITPQLDLLQQTQRSIYESIGLASVDVCDLSERRVKQEMETLC